MEIDKESTVPFLIFAVINIVTDDKMRFETMKYYSDFTNRKQNVFLIILSGRY